MLTHLETDVAWISDDVNDRGPAAELEQVVLRDGSSVVIRTLAAGDETAIASWYASWFAGLSAETLYARLSTLLKWHDPRAEPHFAHVDRCDHEAIMAFAPDGVTVGIVRYLRTRDSSSAEVTVAVADEWRARGIASTLLERVAARARVVGIEQLAAICLAGNHTLIRLLSRLGPTSVTASKPGLVDVRIDVSSAPPDRCAPGPASAGPRD